jgi:hypothetical protein
MFGDDSPERGTSGGGQTQSMHSDLMRTKMTRQERMAAIEEEDQRLAKEAVEQSQVGGGSRKGKGKQVDHDGEQDGARAKKRGKSVAIASDASDEDRQPARKRTEKKDGAAPIASTNKRSRAASRDPGAASSSEDESARSQRKRSKAPEKTPAPKNAKEAAALKKAEKEAKEKESAKLLQVKTSKRKAAVDQAFNEDFNALKIVRPVLKSMPKVDKRRMGWDDNDSDVERHDRLVQEDQERLAHQQEGDDDDMDPENWRRPTQAMFVIKTLEIERKERPAPRTDVDERWSGMVNFKKFRVRSFSLPSFFANLSLLLL